MADREGVKIFQADIIYHLFDRWITVVLRSHLKLNVTTYTLLCWKLWSQENKENHNQVHWIPSGHREEEERAVREDRGVPLQAEDAAGSHLHSQRSHCCWSQGWGEWLSYCNHGPFGWKSRRRNGITWKHLDPWMSRLVLSSVAPRSVSQARSSFIWEYAHHFRWIRMQYAHHFRLSCPQQAQVLIFTPSTVVLMTNSFPEKWTRCSLSQKRRGGREIRIKSTMESLTRLMKPLFTFVFQVKVIVQCSLLCFRFV